MQSGPTIITIFGATGDLSQKKVIPALFELYCFGFLPKQFFIIGFSRRDWHDIDFQEFLQDVLLKNAVHHDKKKLQSFIKRCVYVAGDFTKKTSYEDLKIRIDEKEHSIGQCVNKLFYLSAAPTFYKKILTCIAQTDIAKTCNDIDGWSRILIEKPFGHDIKHAQHLEHLLQNNFKEEQIYRIDHYLGKGMLQNILLFRFTNSLFQPIWNNKHIEKIEITLFEKGDIGTRGNLYENLGALRDVGQNHILSMLALITMDNPKKLDHVNIRKQREKILSSLHILNKKDIALNIKRGQYDSYKKTHNVKNNSQTETFFHITAQVDLPKWSDVPIILQSGKGMKSDDVSIKVHFKKRHDCFCPQDSDLTQENILTFTLKPHPGISILFWHKTKGYDFKTEKELLSFKVADEQKKITAYQKILYDCIVGDQTLFMSNKEVESAWKFITPILKHWEKLPLIIYKKGSSLEEILTENL